MKKILIAGAGSYIGTSVEKWLNESGCYETVTIDMQGIQPKTIDFTGVDAVFHVAGIAHRKETEENAHLYYEVNGDLAIRTAEAAKKAGVKQFILLSSMSVYGINTGVITKQTIPSPKSHYGKSKLQADEAIQKLQDDKFKVCIVRPPMVYGKGCKGNYQLLRKLAIKSPVFPGMQNQRSMIFIDNLSVFVEQLIRNEADGLFFPQNQEYVSTVEMVRCIAKENNHKMLVTNLANFILRNVRLNVVNKVFGDLIYDCKEDRCGQAGSFAETIHKTER